MNSAVGNEAGKQTLRARFESEPKLKRAAASAPSKHKSMASLRPRLPTAAPHPPVGSREGLGGLLLHAQPAGFQQGLAGHPAGQAGQLAAQAQVLGRAALKACGRGPVQQHATDAEGLPHKV